MRSLIPFLEEHRGIGIHDHQTRERIDGIVKPAIDAVLALSDVRALYAFAGDVSEPPEARLLAGAKCEALFELAIQERRERPPIDLAQLRALTAGLDGETWRDPAFFGTLLDRDLDGRPAPVRREVPIPE